MKFFNKDWARCVFRVGKQNDVQGQTLKVCLDKREKFDNTKATTFQIERLC